MAQLKLRILLHLVFVKTLFIQTNEQEYIVKSSNDPIKAEKGSDVILPCHLEPQVDVSRLFVDWKRGSQHVHLRRRGYDFPEEQDPWFKDRTQLFHQEMKHGNISLKLFNVTKEDEGNYTCSMPKLEGPVTKKDTVTLIIVEPGIKEEQKEGPENDDKKNSKGLVAGGISAIVIIIIISAIVAFLIWRKYRRGKQPPSSKENQTNPATEEVPLNNLPADQPTNQQQPPVHEEVQPVNEEVPLNNINVVMSEE